VDVAKTKYFSNTVSFIAHYKDKNNRDKLWTTGAAEHEITETPLPRLLALPIFVAEFLGNQGGLCLPYKLWEFIKNQIDGWGSQIQPKNGSSSLIGALQLCMKRTGQTSSTLVHWNRHCARTLNSWNGANNA
jgi:hypothetical protein